MTTHDPIATVPPGKNGLPLSGDLASRLEPGTILWRQGLRHVLLSTAHNNKGQHIVVATRAEPLADSGGLCFQPPAYDSPSRFALDLDSQPSLTALEEAISAQVGFPVWIGREARPDERGLWRAIRFFVRGFDVPTCMEINGTEGFDSRAKACVVAYNQAIVLTAPDRLRAILKGGWATSTSERAEDSP